jgi:hypothetical protein
MDRILLGHLGKSGDCLYATILARQLRADHPDAHITWAISSQCAGLIANNPHINAVWQIEMHGRRADHVGMWMMFEREALQRYRRREFDHVLLSQIWPNNLQNYDGTVRPSVLRAYGRPITVPIENVIDLTTAEIECVEQYATAYGLHGFGHRILFECSAMSDQSFVNPDFAQAIAQHLYEMLPDVTVIFNSHLPMQLQDHRSRYSGSLSLRELARLTKHCTLFVGCGSGGSVAASSTAAQPLPMIQLLSASSSMQASFRHDFEYFGIKDRSVLELTRKDPKYIANCIAHVCRAGIDAAIAQFGSPIPVGFGHYFPVIEGQLLASFRYIDAARSLSATAARYGWRPDLIAFGEQRIAPNLQIDPSWIFAGNRRTAERFRAELEKAKAAA